MSVHHGRKKQVPTQVICLPAPKEVANDPAFKKTNKTIIKQLISVELIMNVTEYQADVYYNSTTGERIQAAFPSVVDGELQRKQTFAMTFRSFESIEELCRSKGVLLGARKNNPNLYTAVKESFKIVWNLNGVLDSISLMY